MLPYTEIIAGSSTNVTTPTTGEISQGNNQLTPYNSAINNGYYRQMSEGIFNLSAEIENVIAAAGLTPTSSLDQLLAAINVLKVPADASTTVKGIVELLTNAELAAGVDTTRAATAAAIASLFSNSTLASSGVIYIPVLLGGVFVKLMVQIKQGASTTTGDATQTITFPATFPNAVLACFVSTVNPTASVLTDAWFQETTKTTSSINVISQWTSSGSLASGITPQIIAIGY